MSIYKNENSTAIPFSGAGSGHKIIDSNNTAMTQRANLQFVGATITDDSTNNTTVVEVEGGGTTIVQKPTVTVETYTYNGTPQGPTLEGITDNMVVTNATNTDAGTYTLTIALKNTSTMIWTDMTTADLTYEYTISKAAVAIPTVSGAYTYDKTSKSATITGFDSTTMTQGGNTSATAAGTYTVTFDLLDSSNYTWSDGTTSQKSGTWNIAVKTVKIPVVSGTYTYDGNVKAAVITNTEDSGYYTQGGVASATAAGTYTITFALDDVTSTKWVDDSIGQKTGTWVVNKAATTITSNPASIALDSSTTEKNFTLSVVGSDGNMTVVSNDTSVATVSLVSGKTYKVTAVANGSTGIAVNVAGNENYESGSLVVSVTASLKPDLVAWSTGTDAQIKAMLDGYYDGSLTLEEIKSVWSVGDVRTMSIASHTAPRVYDTSSWQTNVTVPAQTTAKWVIIGFDHDTLSETIGGKTKALVTIQMLGFISKEANGSTTYYMSMNDTNTNANSWKGCVLRNYFTGRASATTLDSDGSGALYNALSFKSWIKKVDKITGTGNGSSSESSVETTKDYVWLPSEWEVQGSKNYGQEGSNGGAQFDYFKTSTNKIKHRGWEGTGSACYWWVRSPYSGNSSRFCFVGSDGSANSGNASYSFGAAPACSL